MSDKPLMFRLHQLGSAECHFAYRMTIVMMRRDLPLHKVGISNIISSSSYCDCCRRHCRAALQVE